MKINSFRLFEQKARNVIVAAVVLVATFVPVIIPAIASAAQLTQRSIAVTNSSISATNVTYQINFTSDGAGGAFIVDFCSNTPVIGQSCTAPTGFDATAAASTSAGFTGDVEDIDANTILAVGTIGATTPISVAVTGITNPSTAGPLYARIITYDTDTNAATYVSATSLGSGRVDDGGAAISITNTIGVSGAVLESMTFCVSGTAIDKDCTNVAAPVLKLGETIGSVVALSADAVSTGSIYTQISTNAVTGAVISLKSNAVGCGGLVRAGAPGSCDILPALTGGVTQGEAKFGVKTATATNSAGATAVGALVPVTGSGYNNTTYALNYVSGDATGVTSTFGDAFLDTAGAPANNKNVALTFGVSISNSTPAGLYSVDLGMIATV